MEPLAAGDPFQLGPWRVHARLGAGGMGTVYLGEDDAGQWAAVKQLRPELTGDDAAWARFRREIALARRVEAACVAGVLDVDTESSSPYVAFEFVDGVTLAEHVTTHGPLSEAQLHALAVGLADALAAIHDADIVHRDLSPNNVLLTVDGPRVVDFGIARPADAAATAVTGSSSTIGTPGWMAPEQARGEAPSQAGDVFAWGCLIAYAAGQSPFGHGRPDEVLYRTVHESPDLPTLPSPLDVLVATALAKSPQQRPSTATLRTRLLSAQGVDTVPAALHATWDVAVGSPDFPAVGTAAVHRRRLRGTTTAVAAVIVVALIAVTSAAVLAPGTTRDLWVSWGWGSSTDAGNEGTRAAPAAVTTPTLAPTPTPTPTPEAPETPDPDDPESYFATDGGQPELSPECAGVLSFCLGNPVDRITQRLGTEDRRHSLGEGDIGYTWYLDGVGLSVSVDDVGSIYELSVNAGGKKRVSTPLTGVTVGETKLRRLGDALRETVGSRVFLNTYSGEGMTVVEAWSYAAAEASEVWRGGVTVSWEEPMYDAVSDARDRGDVDALMELVGERSITSFSTGYVQSGYQSEDSLLLHGRESGNASLGGRPGQAPSWVEDELAEARTGYELEDGSHWDPTQTLNVVTGSTLNSASAGVMHAFFFVDGEGYIGTDTADPSQTVRIVSSQDDMVTIKYDLYRQDDAACCPTGGTQRVRFEWTGDELRPLDEIPPLDGPVHR